MSSETPTQTKLPNYGGQAVIEGVMMRGKKFAAIAMRNPEGEITIHTEKLNKIYQSKIMKIPFLRGLIGLNDALILGMKALTISANTQTGEDEKLEGPALFFTFALSLAIAVLIFFLIPAGVGQAVEKYLKLETMGWQSDGRIGTVDIPDRLYVGHWPDGRHQTCLFLPWCRT